MKKLGALLGIAGLALFISALPARAAQGPGETVLSQDESVIARSGMQPVMTTSGHIELRPVTPHLRVDAYCPTVHGCSGSPACHQTSCEWTYTGDNVCSDGNVAVNCGTRQAAYAECYCDAIGDPKPFCGPAVVWACV